MISNLASRRNYHASRLPDHTWQNLTQQCDPKIVSKIVHNLNKKILSHVFNILVVTVKHEKRKIPPARLTILGMYQVTRKAPSIIFWAKALVEVGKLKFTIFPHVLNLCMAWRCMECNSQVVNCSVLHSCMWLSCYVCK